VRGGPLSPAQRPVVVGLDATGGTTELLEFAFDEASRRGAELLALHSWTYRQVMERRNDRMWWAPAEAARSTLGTALTGWREKYPDVPIVERTVHADPVHALIAESIRSQLVVVSARDRGDAAGPVLGPVSQQVVAGAHCPVAVVSRAQRAGLGPRTELHPVPS
jgi:nucleotide-binding universal stress UspA family protein